MEHQTGTGVRDGEAPGFERSTCSVRSSGRRRHTDGSDGSPPDGSPVLRASCSQLPHRTVTANVFASLSTRKLSPMDDGNRLRFAALRSSADSFGKPPWSGIASRSSSSSASERCSSGASVGTRKAGEVPRRGAYPTRELLVGEGVAGSRADEVEVESFDEAVAN